jgi:hypothetical protein
LKNDDLVFPLPVRLSLWLLSRPSLIRICVFTVPL